MTSPADTTPESTTDATAPTQDNGGTAEAQDAPATTASDDASGNHEAAKYRHRAKTAEAERDQLRARLEHVQRGEVERMATTHLRDGTDVWRDGAQLSDLLDENGNVDPDKVSDLGRVLTEAHPHWSTVQGSSRERGMQSGASGPDLPRRDAFAAAFAPRARD